MNSNIKKIVIKADRNLLDWQMTNDLKYKPCAICNEVHVDMSEFLIGFFIDGTKDPVCLECAKKHEPVLYYLWNMGILPDCIEEFRDVVTKYNVAYERLRGK